MAFSNDKSEDQSLSNNLNLNPQTILPWPTQVGSDQFKYEIRAIKEKMGKLNEAGRQLAIKDARNQSVTLFSDVIPGFDINLLPKTKILFDKVKQNAGFQSGLFKDYFARKRPYQEDVGITACVDPKASDLNRSYPSGHTTMGYAMGIILANLIPEKSKELMDRAQLYGENRVNCGAHFPSDVVAGQVLGSIVALELLKNDEFKMLMKDAKNELALAGITEDKVFGKM